jgi:hypothetical protein
VLGLLVLAPAAQADSLGASVDYLAAHQDRPSGGFSSGRPGAAANHAYSAWAAMAVAAAREAPRRWRPGRGSLSDALTRLPAEPGVNDLVRAAVAARAAGSDPRKALGVDPVPAIRAAQAADGSIGGGLSTTAWSVFALRASGVGSPDPAIARAASAIRAAQRRDGGWVAGGQRGTDVITTATAIQALAATGARPAHDAGVRRARAYLVRALRRDGGFGVRRGRRSRAVPAAWAALAIAAMGERSGVGRWAKGGGPLRYLARSVGADGRLGAAGLATGDPPMLAQALTTIALAGRPLPFVSRGRRRIVRHQPRVISRQPAPRGRVTGALIVQYRDDRKGAGIDPARVRLRVDGRNLTPFARVTPFSIQLPERFLPPGGQRVRLDLVDRAGNRSRTIWTVLGPPGGR